MHYVPHQRSLPPIPMTTSSQGTPLWQRSSLPARSRARSPTHTSWQRSSLPVHPRRRPASYYEPESENQIVSSSSGFDQYSRSSSNHNLQSRLVSTRYASDDLTPLNPRSNFYSLDRRFNSARSAYDIHSFTDSHFSVDDFMESTCKTSNPLFTQDDHTVELRRESFFDNIRDPISRYPFYDPRNKNYLHRHLSPSSYNGYDHRRFAPSMSLPSRHGSADEMDSPLNSFPPSPRSKTNSYLRDSPIYDRQSFGSKSSVRKEYKNFIEHNSYPEAFSTGSKVDPPATDNKFVYLKEPAPQHCTQVLATLVVSLGPLCAGLGKGYSSPALASMDALSAQGQHFPISKDQGSWVASLSLLGAFFGSLPAGMSVNWGRKRVLCLVAIPFALSWVMTVLATNVYMLYAAAILGGVCTAVISVVTPIYISEIAHPEIRGCLCSFSKMNSNVGMLISYLLGAFLNWRELATVTAIAPACLFVCSLLIPETPSFLLYRGRDTEAMEALKWLRGSTTDVSREMTTMKANIAALKRHEQQPFLSTASRDLIRPLFITCGLMVFQKFSGANAFNFYAVPILSETFVGLNPYRAAVVVAFVQICAGMASSALVDTVGRRPLLIFSNMLMAASLAAFGCYVYIKGLHQNTDSISKQEWKESDWVPLFCILVIEIAYALGVSPISWLYIGELFPLKHRGFGAIAASISYVCSFASVKTFVDLQNWLGLHGAFWFYASIAALALVFTLLVVPETKGKSLQEMQALEQQKETLI